MKLIIQQGRVVASATGEYTGPEDFIAAPADFDISRLAEYRVVDGVAVRVPGTRITKLAFDNRFTDAELVTIEMYGLDNPAASMAQRQMAATMRVNQRKIDRAAFIDLARLDTREGVQMLEAAGILAGGRALQILDAPVLAEEKPL
jgi:hypothetical protein